MNTSGYSGYSGEPETIEQILSRSPLKLNLACGLLKIEDYVGVDISPKSVADIRMDLMEYPWPFKDNSVDEIFVAHYIEHLPQARYNEDDEFIRFMNECYRILKPDSGMKVIAPYYTSIRAFQDPTHKRFISEFIFCYCNKKWRLDNGVIHYPFTCDFEFQFGFDKEDDMKVRSDAYMEFAVRHYFNVVKDIHVTLKKNN